MERGFFNTIFYRTYTDKALKHRSVTTATEKFMKPEKTNTRDLKVHGSYEAVNARGEPIPGKVVKGGDVIIAKTIELKEPDPQGFTFKDVSTVTRNNEYGTVDKVIPDPVDPNKILAHNAEGDAIVKARVSVLRKPEIGDKFASRYSQKGTCGILYRSVDLPMTADGLVPDIIMNPHGIPSRMTVGKLLETMLGKIAVNTGQMQDATPFLAYDFNQFRQSLKDYGMDELGNEVMYNGQTGQMFDAVFFYGPTYYQRLKHMVDDKVHCGKGDHEVLTGTGWKFFPEVTMNDEIATLKDGQLVYEKPIKVLSFPDFSGKMYRIKNQQVDLDVTLNHRMWVSRLATRRKIWQPFHLETAESVYGCHVSYQKDGKWECPDYQFILPAVDQYPEKIVNMSAWLTFFGIWIAEGCAVHSSDNSHYVVNVCQCKQRVRDALYPALETLGYHYTVGGTKKPSYPTGDALNINSKQLHAYLLPLSPGAPHKRLPEWAWKLSRSQSKLLLDSLVLGDGTHTSSGSTVYYTSSKGLADDVQRLCLHAGWSGNIHVHLPAGHTATKKDGEVITANYDLLSVRINKCKNTPSVNHGHQRQQHIQEEEIYDYTGPVYCLQVPSEVFYIRHNGIPVWTGNSRESGPVQLMTRQPAEGRSRDGGLRLGEMERDVLIAHGIPKFLKERMMDSSDLFKVCVSKKEEAMIVGNSEQHVYKFNGQQIKDDEIMQVQLPYAMKLLLQELESMGLDIRLQVS